MASPHISQRLQLFGVTISSTVSRTVQKLNLVELLSDFWME